MLATTSALGLGLLNAPLGANVASRSHSVDMMARKLPKTAKTATRSLFGYTVSQGIGPADVGFNNRAFLFDPTEEIGAQAPLGYWDPLNFSEIDPEFEGRFLRYRTVELKHGRVAMLACLGYIVPYFSKLPGALTLDGSVTFESVPLGIKAIEAVPYLGWAQILLLAGALEAGPFAANAENPGDFGFDPLNLTENLDSEELEKKKAAELANGRLAMIAALGFLVGDVLNDGNPYAGGPFASFL